MLGKSNEQKQEDARDKQFKRSVAQQGLQGPQQEDSDAAEVLQYLSNIDDLPDDLAQDPVLGQLVSKLTSTANLTSEQVKSNEWVVEYVMLLYLCKYPKKKGLHGSWRGVAHSDPGQDMEPLDPEKRMMIESFVNQSKIALTRSEDAKVMEEGTRNISESVVHDETQSSSKGGIWGKIRG